MTAVFLFLVTDQKTKNEKWNEPDINLKIAVTCRNFQVRYQNYVKPANSINGAPFFIYQNTVIFELKFDEYKMCKI